MSPPVFYRRALRRSYSETGKLGYRLCTCAQAERPTMLMLTIAYTMPSTLKRLRLFDTSEVARIIWLGRVQYSSSSSGVGVRLYQAGGVVHDPSSFYGRGAVQCCILCGMHCECTD